jgi:hypothetical protein
MNNRFLFFIIMLMGLPTILSAQEGDKPELGTLFKDTDNKIDHSGYAGLSVGYLQIDGHDVLTLGGRAGWIIDHNMAIGLAGKGLLNTIYLE